MQVPRTVGLVHVAYVLEKDASFPRGGRPPAGPVQRCLQGDGWQRWEDPDPCGPEHKAPRQAGFDLLRRVSRFLPPKSKNGLPGNAGPHVQQHGHGHQRLRLVVLRARLQGRDGGVRGELPVSVPLVLRCSVQKVPGAKRA